MAMGKTGIPWVPREWEYDQLWDGNGKGMGIRCMEVGIKTLEWDCAQYDVKFHVL